MTLLEAVIAFVLLSVVGVVCLDQTRGATQLQVRSAEWSAAVARAESVMAQAASGSPVEELAGDAVRERSFSGGPPQRSMDSTARRALVSRAPWRTGIDRLSVRVPLSSGGWYVLERLVPVVAMGTR